MGSKLSKNSVVPQNVISQLSGTAKNKEHTKLNSLFPEPSTLQDTKFNAKKRSQNASFDENAIQFIQVVKGGKVNELEAIYKSIRDEERSNLINYRGMWGCTPLLSACLYGQTDVAIWLLDHDADKDLCNERGVTPILLAALEGMTTVISKLISDGTLSHQLEMDSRVGIVYNAAIDRNMRLSPLLAASANGHVDIVELLLCNGAECNQTVNSVAPDGTIYQQSALLLSVKYRHSAVTRILLRYAADITLCDEDGNNALMLACSAIDEDCAIVLIEHAKQRNCAETVLLKCNVQGYTAIHYASLYNLPTICQRIIESLEPIKLSLLLSMKTNTFDETALHLASQKQNAGIVTILFEANANGEFQDSSGELARKLFLQ
ncbi:unnamed protein product [Albugo candida]|uniref:Uncharacterized protein n=1 Tax=Albugo candida TaxID=65357 RepID=A0A024G803_9STRA|nr:unnamed protein product [Albugo candida]|eukprot:CCI42868.1 unnamed protein product [Albugo candida]